MLEPELQGAAQLQQGAGQGLRPLIGGADQGQLASLEDLHPPGGAHRSFEVRGALLLDRLAEAQVEHLSRHLQRQLSASPGNGVGAVDERFELGDGDHRDGDLRFGDDVEDLAAGGSAAIGFRGDRGPGTREVAEGLGDQRFGVQLAQVADYHQGDVLGAVPALVESADELLVERVADLLGADRDPLGVASAAVLLGHPPGEDAVLRGVPLALLAVDHALLVLHLLVGEQQPAGEVAQHLQPFADRLLVAAGEVELVDCLGEGGVGVGVRPEAHPVLLEPLDQRAGLEVLRAVEGHVLEEVGHAELRFGLGEGAGVDVHPQVDAVIRFAVVRPGVAHPVLEVSEVETRIDGDVGGLVLPGADAVGGARLLDRLLGEGRRSEEGEKERCKMRHGRSFRRSARAGASATLPWPYGVSHLSPTPGSLIGESRLGKKRLTPLSPSVPSFGCRSVLT